MDVWDNPNSLEHLVDVCGSSSILADHIWLARKKTLNELEPVISTDADHLDSFQDC
jgi:hypothetical protein